VLTPFLGFGLFFGLLLRCNENLIKRYSPVEIVPGGHGGKLAGLDAALNLAGERDDAAFSFPSTSPFRVSQHAFPRRHAMLCTTNHQHTPTTALALLCCSSAMLRRVSFAGKDFSGMCQIMGFMFAALWGKHAKMHSPQPHLQLALSVLCTD